MNKTLIFDNPVEIFNNVCEKLKNVKTVESSTIQYAILYNKPFRTSKKKNLVESSTI